MRGTIFFVCWTSWISRCSLVAISFSQTESRVKEGTRRYFRRRFGDGEAEIYEFGDGETKTYKFGVAQSVDCEENSPQDVSDSNSPENAKAEQGSASTSVWKQMQSTSQNPAEYYQVRKQEDAQNADAWKQEKRSDYSDTTSVWKQTRSVDTHMNRSQTQPRDMEIPNHRYFGKVLQILRKKLGTTENLFKFGIEAVKTNILIWDCSCHHTLRIWKYTRTRTSRRSKFIRYHSEVDIGPFWRDSECKTN